MFAAGTPAAASRSLKARVALSNTGSASSPAARTTCHLAAGFAAVASGRNWLMSTQNMSTADDRRATDRDAIEPFSTCAYILIYCTPSKRSQDALSTRRKKLHPLPRGRAAADTGGGRELWRPSAGLGVARRSQADRADLPFQEFPRGLRLRRARSRACGSRRTSPRDHVWLGLRHGLAAHQEDQGSARERLHHGGKARSHHSRGRASDGLNHPTPSATG